MENMIKDLKSYLYEVLDVQIKIRPWKKKDTLPFFLVDSYDFHETSLIQQPCLLMVAKEGIEPTPATTRKHWKLVQKKWAGLCIYVQKVISSYNRKRLIGHRVPFVVPYNQMYLPDLGIDLREHFRKQRTSKKSFSPATQAVVIYALRYKTAKKFIPSEIARELDYTLMTMTRAFDELETAGIGEIHRKGRMRYWNFKGSKRELWKQTKPLMRNPVKNRVWLKGKKTKIQAGLSALTHFSMLNPPAIPVYAISMGVWKIWKKSGVKELPTAEDATFELEIWHYNPSLFAKEEVVDSFSLYMSLQENEDERIEAALEKMMEKIKW